MKRFYASLVAAIIAIALCLCGTIFIKTTCESLVKDIEKIQEVSKSGDFASAKNMCEDLSQRWKKVQNYFIPFVNMNRVDEISEIAFTVKSFCSKESEDHFYATLIELAFLINDVKAAENISIFSFL